MGEWKHAKTSRCPECGTKHGDLAGDHWPSRLSARIAELEEVLAAEEAENAEVTAALCKSVARVAELEAWAKPVAGALADDTGVDAGSARFWYMARVTEARDLGLLEPEEVER